MPLAQLFFVCCSSFLFFFSLLAVYSYCVYLYSLFGSPLYRWCGSLIQTRNPLVFVLYSVFPLNYQVFFFLLLFVDASSVRNPFSSSCVQTSSLPVFKARGPSLHFNNLLCFLFPSFSLGRERSFHYHDDQLVL